MGLAIKKVGGFAMKVLLVNGSPHKEGCTYTALCEVADTLKGKELKLRFFGSETSLLAAASPV